MNFRTFFLYFICLLFGFSIAYNAEVPTLKRPVTDQTGTLSESAVRTIEEKLYQFEQETSTAIVVLMISSTDELNIEDYSLQVCEKNKLGKKGKDNGAFLLIAKDDRKLRIEVGYGLEGVLTDALSDQIIRKVIVPQFRAGDFYRGIDDGVEAIMLATKGEFKGEGKNNGVKKYSPFGIILLILIFGFFRLIFGGVRRSYIGSSGYYSRSPWLGGGFGGGGFGGSGGGSFGGFSGGGSFGGGGASGSW